MSEMSAAAEGDAQRPTVNDDAFDHLTRIGWRKGVIAIVAGLAASFLLFGYATVYWRNADMDFMVIYNALVMNDGKPQHFFDHTAYLTILTVKSWFSLLHGIGLLDAWTLPAIPKASDAAAFDAAMTQAVRAGRVLAFLIATGCVLIFAGLTRLIVRDWRIALLTTLAFALSGGIAVHSRILRSELVAACPVIFALMILMAAGRRASSWRPLAIGSSAALCVLGLENKVQAILLIGLLPLVILPFGSMRSPSVPFWRGRRDGWLSVAAAGAIALASTLAAWPLIATGLARPLLDSAGFHPLLLGRYGVYQVALGVFILLAMTAYGWLWRISTAETLASICAVIAGSGLTLLLLHIAYATDNVIAVVNPLEKMLTFADANTASAASGSSPLAVALLLIQGVGSVLARYSFVLHSSARPTVFLTWLIIPGIVYAFERGERRAALQAIALMFAAIVIDTLGVRRGLKSEYFIFTDPLIILAGAVLLDRLRNLRFHKWAFPVALTLIVLHIGVGQSEPIKYAFKRTGPEQVCEWNGYYMPLLPLPWCPPHNALLSGSGQLARLSSTYPTARRLP
jgi:hypothetical protein